MARTRPTDTDGEEGFLSRWSRRKRDAEQGTEAQPEIRGEGAESAPQAVDPPVAEPSAPPKTDADMPPVESIDETTNIGDFFSPEVSEELRRLALRRLFHLPKFNIIDELDDYNESFRNFAALGDIITADMRYHMERAEEEARTRLEESTEAPDAATLAQADGDDAEANKEPAGDGAEDEQQQCADQNASVEPSTDSDPTRPRQDAADV